MWRYVRVDSLGFNVPRIDARAELFARDREHVFELRLSITFECEIK